MGVMRFVYSPADLLPEPMLDHVYLSGLERIAWKAEIRHGPGWLEIWRSVGDAGCLHVPWRVEGHELLTLSTATLIERLEPYCLPVELARGKIGQVRNLVAECRAAGVSVPEKAASGIDEATRWFSQSVVANHGAWFSTELADRALRAALEAGCLLADSSTAQLLSMRCRFAGKLDALFGVDLGLSLPDAPLTAACAAAFNAGRVGVVWREIEPNRGEFYWDLFDRQIEWCRTVGLSICAGPLVQLDSRTLPDWLPRDRGHVEELFEEASTFVEAAVTRYRRAIDLWIAAGRVNTADAFPLTEEENIRLAAQAIQATRCLDPGADVTVFFDQPWSEYGRRQESEYPPLYLADALIRGDLGLTGLGLEINVDYVPGGTLPRDPVEFGRQIDHWGLLGAPLYVALTVPSASHADPLAQRQAATLSGNWTPQRQQEWVSRYVPLLLAKPFVHGVIWGQLGDFEPHPFCHGGLFDAERRPKPALEPLAAVRRAYLR
jgi:hypothetical protein